MEKYVLAVFAFVGLVTIGGFLTDAFFTSSQNNIQGAVVMRALPPTRTISNRGTSSQSGASVFVSTTKDNLNIKGTNPQTKQLPKQKVETQSKGSAAQQGAQRGKYEQSKTAKSGLIIKNGMQYTGTSMGGIVQVRGISVSVNTLQEKGVTLVNGQLFTPQEKDVQIKDYELRRRAIKLQFRK